MDLNPEQVEQLKIELDKYALDGLSLHFTREEMFLLWKIGPVVTRGAEVLKDEGQFDLVINGARSITMLMERAKEAMLDAYPMIHQIASGNNVNAPYEELVKKMKGG